jgi:hypothetical protein
MTDANMRASDADRGRAVTMLCAQCEIRRISPETMERRIRAADAAVRLGDLTVLFGDLPVMPALPVRDEPPTLARKPDSVLRRIKRLLEGRPFDPVVCPRNSTGAWTARW